MNRALSAAACAILALAFLIPSGDSRAQGAHDNGSARAAGSVTLPVAGVVLGGGSFQGAVTINRFARQGGQLVAIGFVRGTITSAAGVVVETGMRSVTLPVTLSSAPAFTSMSAVTSDKAARVVPAFLSGTQGGKWLRVQATTCGVLHIELGPVAINLLGFNVSLSAVTLDLSGDSAGPLGALVCQVVALLGTVADVVGLLNSILGLLTGLLGGLTGGLGA